MANNEVSANVENPFTPSNVTTREGLGHKQVMSREMAETQAKYMMAQQFPRDVIANMDKILNAFTRPNLAEKSQYQFARGGSDIVGPSIRAAEAIAQQWGNMEFGFRELARNIGSDGVPYSDVEAFATDIESRTRRPLQFIVKHWRDTKKGGYKLTDERDIYELIANQAQRRVRACILAVLPGDVVDAAMQQAEMTLRTKADTSPEAMQKMLEAFTPFGVTKEHIEKRIQRRLDSIQPAQVVMLKRIYASLRDDMSTPADWFEIEAGAAPAAAMAAPKELPTCSDDDFGKKKVSWQKTVAEGKKSAADLITMIESKTRLTNAQKTEIRAWEQMQGPKDDAPPPADDEFAAGLDASGSYVPQ